MAAKPHKRDFCVMLNISLIRHGKNKIFCVREILLSVQEYRNTELRVLVQNQSESVFENGYN